MESGAHPRGAGASENPIHSISLPGKGRVRGGSSCDPLPRVLMHATSVYDILVWVDDAIIFDNHKDTRERFVRDLSKRFPTEDKGELKWILGIAVDRD